MIQRANTYFRSETGVHKDKKSSLKVNKFRHFLSKFDIMASPFDFYLPDNSTAYQTTMGGIATIIFAITFAAFLCAKLAEFSVRDNYTMNETTLENQIGVDQKFGRQNNFVVAASLIGNINSYDGDVQDVGELKFYLKKYDGIDPEVTFT